MTRYISLLAAIDGLYESVVTDPDVWTEQSFADWAGDSLRDASDLPRPAIREVRRCLRAAQKLQAFWAKGAPIAAEDDWRSRVDIGLGARAWRPALDLAMVGLAEDPSPEIFAEIQARFPVVHSDRWMEGIDYETWLDRGK